MYVSVAINVPPDKAFTYAVPEPLAAQVAIGRRVLVPFGRRRLTGYIIDTEAVPAQETVKDILEILDDEPLFNEEDLKFYRWASDYYLYPIGKALHEILPGGISLKSERWIGLREETASSLEGLSDLQRRIMDIVKLSPKGVSWERLKKNLSAQNIGTAIKALVGKGLIEVSDRMTLPGVRPRKEKIITLHPSRSSQAKLTPNQSEIINYIKDHEGISLAVLRNRFRHAASTIRSLEKRGIVLSSSVEVYRSPGIKAVPATEENRIVLNEDQRAALAEIKDGMASGKFSPFLLHGVTGSGKTEVYLKAMEEALGLGGGVIYLVPEIALTPQLISRVAGRFNPDDIAVLHSNIPISIRYDQWRRIRRGATRLIVGARSALFAPVRDLKLIIVDEEHDNAYKQDERMCYHARDLALVRAKLRSAVVVLGSATPSVQTFYNAGGSKYRYLSMPARVENRPLPEVVIVDMKAEQDERGDVPILSRSLRDAIADTLDGGKQTLLFLNRRGFHTFVFCRDCGHVFRCPNCELSLTFHAGRALMKCHTCDYAVPPSAVCPSCRCDRITSYGVGTERLEKEVQKWFPQARVGRMDSDTTSRRGDHEKILHALHRGELDILVGTQMITKGHDVPAITLVGVISADTGLNIPDFRAAERTFQLLTQVSGRGGRGEAPGRVIIQSFNPDHYAIRRAKDHDYDGFYADELPMRHALFFPPFSRIVNVQVSSLHKDRGSRSAMRLGNLAKEVVEAHKWKGKIDILGPAEAPVARARGRYRWQILLKGREARPLHAVVRTLLERARGLDIRVDVDPVNFM